MYVCHNNGSPRNVVLIAAKANASNSQKDFVVVVVVVVLLFLSLEESLADVTVNPIA